MNANLINALRLLVRLARRNRFFGSARDLSRQQPTVPPQVAVSERDPGTALFDRSERAVVWTETEQKIQERIGRDRHAVCATDDKSKGEEELFGTLKIGLTSSLAIREIIPRLPEFISRHPALSVELVVDDGVQVTIAGKVDIAIRFGTCFESHAVVRKLTNSPLLLAASPDYLARFGHPLLPADLVSHRFVAGPNWQENSLRLKQQGREVTVRIEPFMTVSENETAAAAALAGLGIVSMSLLGCRQEVSNGSLVRLFSEWSIGEIDIYAIFDAGCDTTPSAEAFVDFLASSFRKWAN